MFKRNPKVIPIFFTKDKDIHEISNSMDEQKGGKVWMDYEPTTNWMK